MTTRICTDPAPDWATPGSTCIKPLARGLDIHGGGHIWARPDHAEAIRTAHFDDPTALIAGGSSTYHAPEECHPGCFSYRPPTGHCPATGPADTEEGATTR